jgi:hypothetical protein
MSPDEPESISSDATEASKQRIDVEALGRRIVDELGLEKGVDTLARWMAHYIAELMSTAAHAATTEERLRIEQQCAEIVLRVWERRSSWPSGWPPAGAEELTRALADRPYQGSDLPAKTTWAGAIPYLEELHRRELRVYLNGALLVTDTSSEQSWLAEWGRQLEENERELLGQLIAARTAAHSLLTERIHKTKVSTEDIRASVIEQLQELEAQRAALLAATSDDGKSRPAAKRVMSRRHRSRR